LLIRLPSSQNYVGLINTPSPHLEVQVLLTTIYPKMQELHNRVSVEFNLQVKQLAIGTQDGAQVYVVESHVRLKSQKEQVVELVQFKQKGLQVEVQLLLLLAIVQ